MQAPVELAPCPWCYGTGILDRHYGPWPHGMRVIPQPCSHCDATGEAR
jgi:DnaJ-class molecular chaperone